MKTLVIGASGATGRLVVKQLIKRNINVRIVVRAAAITADEIKIDSRIEIVKGNIYDFDIEKFKELLNDCDSIICCLGHNISFKGIFGPPHRLVSNTVKKIYNAIEELGTSPKFILMSTTAYTNKNIGELNTKGEKIIFSLLKLFLPPHKDNMLSADYLIYKIGANTKSEWVAVRPDSLFDEESESDYEVVNCKKRSPIFNPGKTSRMNVSCFMAELISDNDLWQLWRYNTPVIYNKE